MIHVSFYYRLTGKLLLMWIESLQLCGKSNSDMCPHIDIHKQSKFRRTSARNDRKIHTLGQLNALRNMVVMSKKPQNYGTIYHLTYLSKNQWALEMD